MSYQKKYLKYKSKYLALIDQLAGTLEEGNDYLLHGTSLFYIDEIKENGLTGRYNDKIYDMIVGYWGIIQYLSVDPYVGFFLGRQKRIRDTGDISLSFTGQSSVAQEYSNGSRRFGEGPSRFVYTLGKYIKNNESSEQVMKEDYEYLYKASRNPGIILAINKNDFEKTKDLDSKNLDEWEYTLYTIIPRDKLYIRRGKNDYVLLLSEEGETYIERLKSEFLVEEERRDSDRRAHFEEIERMKLLNEWLTDKKFYREYLKYSTHKKDYTIKISVIYDINDEHNYPHYFSINIDINPDIEIDIVIKNILKTTEYCINKRNMKGIELLKQNNEAIDKLKLAIKEVMKEISSERQAKIFEKISEIFPYLSE